VGAVSIATIQTEGLTKLYGAQLGIVDVEVKAGEVFGFLGPNGAGKSTTIRLMLDLIRPTRLRHDLVGRDPTADVKLPWLPDETARIEELEQRLGLRAC
jgi:ABC-2 type transport system ATP-binding protein